MTTYKVKSLSNEVTDQELENSVVWSTSFMSFDRAVKQEAALYPYKKLLGYKVTEQGIEIIWK